MKAVLLGVSVVLAGCFEPDLVDCGNGTTCPGGTACDIEHSTCIDPMQVEACAGKDEGDDCRAGDVIGGCFGGTCFARGCGNRIVEPGAEQCDDGNLDDSDGCSANCESTEVCGNGIVDTLKGEECEDGNLMSRDGCDSLCKLETVEWAETPLSPSGYFREGAAGVYDPVRKRFVIVTPEAVWEEADGAWTVVPGSLASAASSIVGGAAWNPSLGSVVAVSAVQVGSAYDLTVSAWDGARWTSVSATMRAEADGRATGIGYDEATGTMVVVGARAAWRVSGAGTWVAFSPLPFYAFNNSLATDPQTGRLIIHSQNGQATYELERDGWTLRASPPGGVGSEFELANDGTHLFALELQSGAMWMRAGGGWTPRPDLNHPAVSPNSVGGRPAKLYFESATGTFALAMGRLTSRFQGTWQPTYWPSSYSLVVARRDGFVLVAPDDESTSAPMRSWRVDRAGVAEVTLPGSPPGRINMRCVRAPGRGGNLCLGGVRHLPGDSVRLDDAFLLDDAGWHELSLGGAPELFAAMAYDPERQRVLMRGFLETYALPDGASAWEQTSSADSPGQVSTMAWDGQARRLVATLNDYVGSGPPRGGLLELVDDTWRPVPLAPVAPLHAIANERRGTIHMFELTFASTSAFVWERTGNQWSDDVAPPPLRIVTGAYSPSSGELMLIGYRNSGLVAVTRRYASSTPTETCEPDVDADGDSLAGCDDPDCYWACSTCLPFTSCAP